MDAVCNGWCQPELCLYEAHCPLHGARVILDALEAHALAAQDEEAGEALERQRQPENQDQTEETDQE